MNEEEAEEAIMGILTVRGILQDILHVLAGISAAVLIGWWLAR